jgi:hypothetical protein
LSQESFPGLRNLGRHSAHFYGKQEAHGSELKITVTNERLFLAASVSQTVHKTMSEG